MEHGEDQEIGIELHTFWWDIVKEDKCEDMVSWSNDLLEDVFETRMRMILVGTSIDPHNPNHAAWMAVVTCGWSAPCTTAAAAATDSAESPTYTWTSCLLFLI